MQWGGDGGGGGWGCLGLEDCSIRNNQERRRRGGKKRENWE